jgi:hypothetical protein
MKKLSQDLEDTLLDYLDGNLASSKREAFEQMLKGNMLLQKRLEELRAADLVLKQIPLEHPSKNFTAHVMNRLDQYPVRSGLSIRNGILLLTGILIVMGIAVVLLSAGVFDETTTFDLNNSDLIQRYIKQSLPQIPVSEKLIVNIILLLNLALAFVVLDRAILKPYFQRRIQAGH